MRRLLLTILATLILAFAWQDDASASSRTPRRQQRSSATVRKERNNTNRKKQRTRQQIQRNIEQTESELRRLESLQGQVAESRTRERDLTRRVDSIAARERRLSDSVEVLTARVNRLDESYRNSLRAIRRQRRTATPAAFVFSAESFSQAIRRIRYLGDLADWNAEQGRLLRSDKERLQQSVERLDSARTRLAASRDTLAATRRRIESDATKATQLIESLRSHTDELNTILARQQAQSEALDNELAHAIEAEEEARRQAEAEELRRAEAERQRVAEEAARRLIAEAENTSKPGTSQQPEAKRDTTPLTAATQQRTETTPTQPAPTQQNSQRPVRNTAQQSEYFESLKGKLPMPVSGKATIVSNFGRRTHTEFAKVEVQNNGIDIECQPGANALAVADGTVSMVIVMDGFQNVVLLRHGQYLTVYAGLGTLSVRKGDNVSAGQALGTIHSTSNDDHSTRLHFEVRHEKEKQDPRLWLK